MRTKNDLNQYYQRNPQSLITTKDGWLGVEVGAAYVINMRNNHKEHLKPLEYGFLRFLLDRKEIVQSREEIEDHLLGPNREFSSNFVDVHAKRVRRVLKKAEITSFQIETVEGVGYVLRKIR